MSNLGEPNNSIPYVLDYYTRNHTVIARRLSDKTNIQLKDLRNDTVLRTINETNLSDALIRKAVDQALEEQDFNKARQDNNRTFDKLKNELHRDHQPILDSLLSGSDLYDIGLRVSDSIDHIFTVMRHIERRLKVNKEEPPVQELDSNIWREHLSEAQRDILDMYFMGFELSEQKKLRGEVNKATILIPRQRALESFDIDLKQASEYKERLTTKNTDALQELLWTMRLVNLVFPTGTHFREDVKFDQLYAAVDAQVQALTPEQIQVINAYTAGSSIEDIKNDLRISEGVIRGAVTKLPVKIRANLSEFIRKDPTDQTKAGESRNSIYYVIDYFIRNEKNISEVLSARTTNQVSLADLRADVILHLADAVTIDDATVQAALDSALKVIDFNARKVENDQALTQVKEGLYEEHRPILEAIIQGEDLLTMAASRHNTVEHVAVVMRLIEREMKADTAVPPAEEFSISAWKALNDESRTVMNLLVAGIETEEAWKLLGKDSSAAIKAPRTNAFKMLNMNFEQVQACRDRIAAQNNEHLKPYEAKAGLINFIFKPGDNFKADIDFDVLQHKISQLIAKLPEDQRTIIGHHLAGLDQVQILAKDSNYGERQITTVLKNVAPALRTQLIRCLEVNQNLSSLGEPNNSIPYVIDYFSRNQSKIEEKLAPKTRSMSVDKLSLADLRADVIIRTATAQTINDRAIAGAVNAALEGDNLVNRRTTNNEALARIREEFKDAYQVLIDGIAAGKDLNTLSLELHLPINQLAKLMSYIERQLKSQDKEPPCIELNSATWQSLADLQRKALNLHFMGFDNQDADQIFNTDLSSTTMSSVKSEILPRFAMSSKQQETARNRIAQKNLQHLQEQICKSKLVHFVFNSGASFKKDAKLNEIYEETKRLFERIPEQHRQAVGLYLEGMSVKDIASKLECSPTTLSLAISSIPALIRSQLARFIEVDNTDHSPLGQAKNSLAYVMNYFTRNQESIASLLTKRSGSKLSIGDLRTDVILHTVNSETINDSVVDVAIRDALAVEAFTSRKKSNDEKLSNMTNGLYTSFKPILEAIRCGENIVNIAIKQKVSVEYLLTVMRYLERKLQADPSLPPMQEFSKTAWQTELTDDMRSRAELFAMGFSYQEIITISDISTNYTHALRRLGFNVDDLSRPVEELVVRNMEHLNDDLRKDRLISLAFDRDELSQSEVNYEKLYELFNKSLCRLPENHQRILEAYLNGVSSYEQLAIRVAVSEATVSQAFTEISVKLRSLAQSKLNMQTAERSSEGQPNNAIPLVMDYFRRKRPEISKLIKRNNSQKWDIAELRNDVILRAAQAKRVSDSSIAALVSEAAEVPDLRERRNANDRAYVDLASKLNRDQQQVLDWVNRGEDFEGLSLKLCDSLDHIFAVMRNIERRLKDADKPSVREFDAKLWANTTPSQRKVLDLFMMGFENEEISKITGLSLPVTVNYKNLALSQLGHSYAQALRLRKALADKNMEELTEDLKRNRLVFYVFDHEDFNREDYFVGDLSLSKIYDALTSLLDSLPELHKRIIERHISKPFENNIEIATAVGSSADTVSGVIKNTKAILRARYESSMHDDRPNTSINQYKWSALEEKFRIIVALACAGLSRSKIYQDSRVQEHYSSPGSVGAALDVARRRLGISEAAWVRYRKQGIDVSAIGDD